MAHAATTRRRMVVVAAAALALLTLPEATPRSVAAGGPYTFRDTTLPGNVGGGEPSIAIDDSAASTGKGYVYVTTVGGPYIWHSPDLGQSWSSPVQFDNSGLGVLKGGDEDVAVYPNGTVTVADLNVSHNVVQLSTDHGQTFNTGTVTGPESDREWFGIASNSVSYLAYHDFVGEVPIVCTSVDGGGTYPVCNQAFTNPAAAQCAENTVMARPVVVDPTDGSVSFLYSCSTAAQNVANPPFGPLHDYYFAHSTVNAQGVPTVFTTTPVFTADTTGGKAPNFANIFSALRVDSAGNYYAVFAGTADDNHVLSNPYHVYFTYLKKGAATWSSPRQIDAELDGKGSHVLPDIVVTSPGNVDIVWLGTSSTGEPNGVCGSTAQNLAGNPQPCLDGTQNIGMKCQTTHCKAGSGGPVTADWRLYMAQSTNALSMTPQFDISQASADIVHQGEICTNGIVCGSSDRSLLDYISVGVDCTGNAHIAYTGNYQQSTSVHEVDQLSGGPITPPTSCGTPTGVIPVAPLAPLVPLAGVVAGAALLATRRRRGVTAAL